MSHCPNECVRGGKMEDVGCFDEEMFLAESEILKLLEDMALTQVCAW